MKAEELDETLDEKRDYGTFHNTCRICGISPIRRSLRISTLMLALIATLLGCALAYDPSGHALDPISRLWPYHAALMLAGLVTLFLGAMVARRKKGRNWLNKHRALAVSGATLVVAGLIMAVYMVSEASEEHLSVPHAYLGALVMLLVLLTPILGYAQLKVSVRPNKRVILRVVHRWSGRLTLTLMIVNALFGLWAVGLV